MPPKHHVQPGQRFGRGVVTDPEIRVTYQSGTSCRGARLRCDCGTVYEASISHLINERVSSCGCLKREATVARNTTHGMTSHPLYHTWKNMMARCYKPQHPDYPNYGGRGITVCPRWHDVAAFLEDIEGLIGPRPEGHSLDRIRSGLGYKPRNTRWATDAQQVANARRIGTSPQERLERRRRVHAQWVRDESQSPAQVAAALGLPYGAVVGDIRWIRQRRALLAAQETQVPRVDALDAPAPS